MPGQHAFARRIREYRESKGLTQEEFAAELGLKAHQISSVERGRTDPSAHMLAAIVSVFNEDPLWLLLGPADPGEPGYRPRIAPSDLAILEQLREHFAPEPQLFKPAIRKWNDDIKEGDCVFLPVVAGPKALEAVPLLNKDVIGYKPVMAEADEPRGDVRCLRLIDNDMAPVLPEGAIVGIDLNLRDPQKAEGRIVCARDAQGKVLIRRFQLAETAVGDEEPHLHAMLIPLNPNALGHILIDLSTMPDPIIGTVVFAWLDLRK